MLEKSIRYTIQKSKRAKRLRLSVRSDGSVFVTAPVGVRKFIIQNFVAEKRHWIDKRLQFFREIKPIRVFSQQDYVDSKEKAKALAVERVEHFKKFYDFTYNRISIKNQKTRWGSCSKKGNLNFNYKIIFLSEEMRDYVIVHEICHLLEFNHSEKFWKFVQITCPNYVEIKKQLRKFGIL